MSGIASAERGGGGARPSSGTGDGALANQYLLSDVWRKELESELRGERPRELTQTVVGDVKAALDDVRGSVINYYQTLYCEPEQASVGERLSALRRTLHGENQGVLPLTFADCTRQMSNVSPAQPLPPLRRGPPAFSPHAGFLPWEESTFGDAADAGGAAGAASGSAAPAEVNLPAPPPAASPAGRPGLEQFRTAAGAAVGGLAGPGSGGRGPGGPSPESNVHGISQQLSELAQLAASAQRRLAAAESGVRADLGDPGVRRFGRGPRQFYSQAEVAGHVAAIYAQLYAEAQHCDLRIRSLRHEIELLQMHALPKGQRDPRDGR